MSFYKGDHVEIANRKGLTGKVISSTIANSIRSYKVQFDDSSLIPGEMEYEESELNIYRSNPAMSRSYQSTLKPWADYYAKAGSKSKESHCPNCDTKWTVTKSPVLHDIWKTCNKCNIRREDV